MSLGTLPNALVVVAVVVAVLARRLSWSELENSAPRSQVVVR